ncbi:MAG TPA: hypothetical protein VFE62_01370 [Gemmataceae bacterium]|nr:hypothetical protein [Gemmataceae bacterium]
MDAEELLKGLALMASIKAEGTSRDKVNDSIEDLTKSYLTKHDFKAGDRIVLKRGMGGMHRCPKPGQVCVVIEALKEPVVPRFERSFGSSHYMAPLDIRIALKDADGDFSYFLMDSRLFEPVKSSKVVQLKRT